MNSERERVARQARAEGAEASARIRADAERERTVHPGRRARRSADQLRGQGEAQAIAIYADAFQRDPHFFSVWRTLQAYREAFANGASRLVLSPGDDFLQLLQPRTAARGGAAPCRRPRPPGAPSRARTVTTRRRRACRRRRRPPHSDDHDLRPISGALPMRHPTRLAMRAGALLLARGADPAGHDPGGRAGAAGAGQLRRPRRAAAARRGQHLLQPDRAVARRPAGAGSADLPARLAVRAVLPRLPGPQPPGPARRPRRRRRRRTRCRASARASSSIRPASW